MAVSGPQNIPLDQLKLDLQNPRFGLSEAETEPEAIKFLLERSDLKELWDSYAQKGYQPFEPLIGIDDPLDGKVVIIEGNRRLAAAKTILDPSLILDFSKKSVPALPKEFEESFHKLPVILVDTREDANDYIGFKHINGPSSWGSLPKAKFGVLLFESMKGQGSPDEVLNNLSKRLGDTPAQALRTLVAYKIFEQAVRNEFLPDPSDDKTSIDFSHLYTMLPNPATRTYLGLGKDPLRASHVVDNPVPERFLPKLANLMGWLFGNDKHEPIIKRQGTDRPKLQKILSSDVATQTLEETRDFEQAIQQAGFLIENWMSNVVRLQSLSKAVYDSVPQLADDLDPDDKDNALKRLKEASTSIGIVIRVL